MFYISSEAQFSIPFMAITFLNNVVVGRVVVEHRGVVYDLSHPHNTTICKVPQVTTSTLCSQGMHDMFIQSQQLVTTNSSSNNGQVQQLHQQQHSHHQLHHQQHQQKKRKVESIANHNSTSTGVIGAECPGGGSNSSNGVDQQLVDAVFAVTGGGQFARAGLTSHAPGASPGVNSQHQQPFVRASTIKLLDTYQRCGQKVGRQLHHGLAPFKFLRHFAYISEPSVLIVNVTLTYITIFYFQMQIQKKVKNCVLHKDAHIK